MFIFRWIRNLYDRTLQLSQHPKAELWLGIISFAESSFFPIPPDVMLLPMCLTNKDKALRYALVCTIASVLGGLFGYVIGVYAFDWLAQPILEFYGIVDKYEHFKTWYDSQGAIVVFIAGFTPIPYKVVTITAGVFQFSLPLFVALSCASRGLRFGIEAFLIQKFGEPAMVFIDRHFDKLTVLGTILLIGGFVVVKFLLPS